MGDFNRDAAVDEIDATLVAANLQQTPTAAVPEPTATILLLLGSFFVAALNFRRS